MKYVGRMTDPTAIPNLNPQPATPAQPAPAEPAGTVLRDRLIATLNDSGLLAEVDQDGDIAYKVDEQQLFVRTVEGEPGLMRVFGQWSITEDLPQDLTKQLQAANDVTLSLSIIKTAIANHTLVVTGEHLVGPESDLKMLLETTTQMVLQAVQFWHQAVTSDGPHAADTDPAEVAQLIAQQQAAQGGADGTAQQQ